jgi:peptidoglycan/xylan/chitin deacetylase (PgdA/CDA1 family)
MGRQVADTALDRDVPHFAYPFGDTRAVGRREIGLAQDAGFASAVTAQAGIVRRQDERAPYALPRLSWAGSWRTMRVLMAGFGDAPVKPT